MLRVFEKILFQQKCWGAAILSSLITIASPLAHAADDIVIGQVSAFSGPLAPTGTDYGRGMEIGFEQFNEKGGIKGRKIRLIKADDGYKAEQTVAKAGEMLTQHKELVAFAGFLGTGNAEALIKSKVLDAQGVPLVGVRTGAAREHNSLIFHLR